MKTISEKENLVELKRNGRLTIIAICVLLIGLWAAKLINETDDAMQKCQETHSYDTCYWNINR